MFSARAFLHIKAVCIHVDEIVYKFFWSFYGLKFWVCIFLTKVYCHKRCSYNVCEIDYSKHPDVETLLPKELSKKYFSGQRYDVMATYSSLEHSGLGRYFVCITNLF